MTPVDVVIGGQRYVPESTVASLPAVGIGVTTLDRLKELDETLQAIRRHTPAEFSVVVVDDGSKKPVLVPSWVRLIRHDKNLGIPAAKNRCIAELMQQGVEHLFLLDDDTYPVRDFWWEPYVDSPEPHLQLSWMHFAKDHRPVPKMAEVYRDDRLVGYTHSMGCMLYFHRSAIERVGGMRLEFGRGFEEHIEHSARIHSAGLTSFAHQDVVTAEPLFYAADEYYAVTRSFKPVDRDELLRRNVVLREGFSGSTDYVEYRAQRDIVLTSMFAGVPDAQYPLLKNGRDADPRELEPLISSVGAEDVVLLHNDPAYDRLRCETVREPCPWSPYMFRWLAQWRYLRTHPEVDMCWMVDATDTTMQRDPFEHMRPRTLFCGWEPKTLDCEWIANHCPDVLRTWVGDNRERVLLNTGVVGGQREVLMELCRRIVDLWVDSDMKDPLVEMCLFNKAVADMQDTGVELVTGPRVTNLFKSGEPDNGSNFWAHK